MRAGWPPPCHYESSREHNEFTFRGTLAQQRSSRLPAGPLADRPVYNKVS